MCRKRDDHEKSTYQVGVNVQNKRENSKKKNPNETFCLFSKWNCFTRDKPQTAHSYKSQTLVFGFDYTFIVCKFKLKTQTNEKKNPINNNNNKIWSIVLPTFLKTDPNKVLVNKAKLYCFLFCQWADITYGETIEK